VDFQIKKAAEKDLPQIIELIQEFAEYEFLVLWWVVTAVFLGGAIFGAAVFVHTVVVTSADETRVWGYAMFFPVFKSFRGERSIFLEDLYVSPAMRGKGLGYAMLKEVARSARAQGFVRMDWQALKWNEPAINFYKNLGAETDDENFDFRLRGENFENLAS
jgi:GNAT superfamily N-acetyltransferase